MSLAIMLKLLQTIKELRQHKKWTLAQLEAFQQNELCELGAHANAHSPFYQRFHQG